MKYEIEKFNDNYLTTISGKMGWGKTISSVALAIEDLLEEGRKIYSNFPIHRKDVQKVHEKRIMDNFGALNKLPTIHQFNDISEISNMITSRSNKIKHSTVIVDETMSIANSRRSMTQSNIDFNDCISQFRKLDINGIILSQISRSIDINIREMLQRRIQCLHDKIDDYHKIFFLTEVSEERSNEENYYILNGEEWEPERNIFKNKEYNILYKARWVTTCELMESENEIKQKPPDAYCKKDGYMFENDTYMRLINNHSRSILLCKKCREEAIPLNKDEKIQWLIDNPASQDTRIPRIIYFPQEFTERRLKVGFIWGADYYNSYNSRHLSPALTHNNGAAVNSKYGFPIEVKG